MNILHYTLGLPPYRKGGLTKYATDLLLKQSEMHNVSLLYPSYDFFSQKKRIKKKKTSLNIHLYELVNALPVPLLEGIKCPTDFIEFEYLPEDCDFEKFFESVTPDVFHIHTLMGLPISLVLFLKKKGTKIIYTTHDYFGLCPKVNFINNQNIKCNDFSDCFNCNVDAPSTFYLKYIRNSEFLLKHRDKIKKSNFHKVKFSKPNIQKTNKVIENNNGYLELRSFYLRLFNLVDYFHFNSSITRDIYTLFLPKINYKTVNILHADIRDNRHEIIPDYDKIKIGYIGNNLPYKGFSLLVDVLEELMDNGLLNWDLYLIGVENNMSEKIKSHVKYLSSYSFQNMVETFNKFDILIMPSLCNETFGFVALEALSFGIPVIISDTCGMKDIIEKITPDLTFSPNKSNLYAKLSSILLNPQLISKYNKMILSSNLSFDFSSHVESINELYQTTV